MGLDMTLLDLVEILTGMVAYDDDDEDDDDDDDGDDDDDDDEDDDGGARNIGPRAVETGHGQ